MRNDRDDLRTADPTDIDKSETISLGRYNKMVMSKNTEICNLEEEVEDCKKENARLYCRIKILEDTVKELEGGEGE